MSTCFADTFFFLSLLNAQDQTYHQKARDANRIDRPIVVTEWILLELADHLCDLRNRHLFGKVLAAIRDDRRYDVVPADAELLKDAMELYIDRPDQEWSLTDCTSFLVMRRRRLTESLTADHHFEQAGFVALLK